MGKDARISSLAPAELEHIGEICRRMDGIPLAIELAAAQAQVRPLNEILEHISQRLDSSEQPGGARDRQSSLRAALDWSYDLLAPGERTLFAELAVFRGGLDLEAAESVSTLPDVLDPLFSLRDKSLLRTEERMGELRNALLETVRLYAAEKLGAEAQGHSVQKRHAGHYLALAESRNKAFIGGGPDTSSAMHTLTTELDNLRSAMDWCFEAGHRERLVAFGKAVARFLITRGLYDECDRRLHTPAPAARDTGDRSALARLLN